MPLTVDDFRKLSDRARERVADLHARSVQEFVRPAVERRELSEYSALTPEQHGRIYQTVGKERYRQYVDAMEKQRQKYGG